MAAVVEDCGSNGFHEYAGKLDAKHEGKHVKVNPTQCAPRLTRPLPAAHRPELSSEGLAPLSRFAPFRRHVTHTPLYCPQACENTQTARRAHSTHGGAPECASAEGAPSLSIAVSVSRELHAALPCLPTCLAGTPLAALVGSRPSAPLRPAVPSRVEAQTRAEPSAGAQGPVLNEEADECRKARAPDDVDNAGAGRCLWLQQ